MNIAALKADRNLVKIAADGYHVATVNTRMDDPEAYARLFATAPELVAVLKDAREAIAETLADNGFDPAGSPRLKAIDAVIAKAEGTEARSK